MAVARHFAWLLLPLAAWLLGQIFFVRPAQRQLSLSQQALLAAERDELTAEMALAREDGRHARMEREVRELAENAVRMGAAERRAQAALDSEHARATWVMPGMGRGRT